MEDARGSASLWFISRALYAQYYPSTGEHKPVYIHAYIKGPKDKPLKLSERVKVMPR